MLASFLMLLSGFTAACACVERLSARMEEKAGQIMEMSNEAD